jgi:hypothetical protein
LNKKVIRVLIIRNGAKGISVFILIFPALPLGRFLEKNINKTLISVPIQNDNIIAQRPDAKPSIHPIPRINFPSPKPISRPFEKSQSKINGKASIGPESKPQKVGRVNNKPTPEKFKKIEIKEMNIKIYTNLSGIILCRKS